VDSQHCRTTRVGLAAKGSLPAAYPESPVTAVGRLETLATVRQYRIAEPWPLVTHGASIVPHVIQASSPQIRRSSGYGSKAT
jgi:hypothetical protein